MARKSFSFGDVAEFSIWACGYANTLTKSPRTAEQVIKLYQEQTGRDINAGVTSRVFARIKIPLVKRPKRKRKAISLAILAQEIVTLNKRVKDLAKAIQYPEADTFEATEALHSYDDMP